jgi:hypothetical protein
MFSVFIFSTLLSGVGQAGQGRLSGTLGLRYGVFTAEEDGMRVADANYATQQYSVLYETSGKLGSVRLGRYDLALGYEWNWVDAEVGMGDEVKIDNPLDKILFRGDIVLDPGGLPFRLNVFSRDMKRTTLETSSVGEVYGFESLLVSGLSNGSHVTTGVTFEGGVTGAYYAGLYRDVLSALPRLLIDYRQEDVHDVKGPNPRDFRDRDLAFISLNKKDNWLHYRVFNHEDRINPEDNYDEESFLLGTIDPSNKRKWVRLTNWIQASGDLSYTEYREVDEVRDSNTYNMNLFTRTERTKWQAANYTSLNRYAALEYIDKSLTVPLFFRGELNQSTSWRFQLVGDRFRKELFGQSVNDYRDSLFFSGQVNAFRQSRYTVTPTLSAVVKKGTRGEGYAARGQFEFSTNPHYRQPVQLFGSYSVAAFDGTSEKGFEVKLVEHELEFAVDYDLSSDMKYGFEGKAIYASDVAARGVFDRISPNLLGSGFASSGSLFVDKRHSASLGSRLEVSYQFADKSDTDSSVFGLEHTLDFGRGSVSASLSNTFSEIEKSGGQLYDDFGSRVGSGWDFRSNGHVRYTPGRALTAKIEYDYHQTRYAGVPDEKLTTFRQDVAYSVWARGGVLRKLFSVKEEISYERGVGVNLTDEIEMATLSLIADYYPSRRTLLRSHVAYRVDEVANSNDLSLSLLASVNFARLRVELGYAYGVRDAEVALDRKEQKLDITVSRDF